MLLASPVLHSAYRVVHVDTADRRPADNMGRPDPRNVYLAFRHAAQLAAATVRHRPDVVYLPVSQNAWAYLRDALLMAVAKGLGCRLVTHLHGGWFRAFYEESKPACRWLVRRTSRWLTRAAVLAPGLRCVYSGLVPEERIGVVPVGIPDPFPAGPPQRGDGTHPPGSPGTVTYLGVLFRPKGVFDLLDAAALLDGPYPPLRFIFAGEWFSEADRRDAEAFVTRRNLWHLVSFIGAVDGEKKRDLWKSTDIFVYPTYHQYEGLPLAVLEAMAAAVPIVTTARAAIRDVLEHGVHGLFIPERDPQRLADALHALARDPGARRRMGEAARARYLAGYTDVCSAQRLVEVLDAACAA